MVVRMTRWFWFASLLAPLVLPVGGALAAVPANLSVRLEQRQVELGKALWMEIELRNGVSSLSELDLSPLDKSFVIAERKSFRDAKTRTRHLRLQLYPLRSGETAVPALHLGDLSSEAHGLTVLPPVDPKTHSPIHVRTYIDADSPWQRQHIALRMEISTTARFLTLRQAQLRATGIQLYAQPRRQSEAMIDGRRLTTHQLRWSLFVDAAGTHRLRLPPVELVRDGVTTHRFYFPVTDVHVRALPIYVPPTMPVGRITLEAPSAFWPFGIADELRILRLRLRGKGVPAQSLPDLAASLAVPRGFTCFAAQVQRRNTYPQGTLYGEAILDIPCTVNRSGLVDGPQIAQAWFDPDSGTLQRTLLRVGSWLLLPRWLWLVLLLGSLLLCWHGARRLVSHLRLRWWRIRHYRRLLAAVAGAGTLHELRRCIADSADVEGWPPGLTARGWHDRWQAHFGGGDPAAVDRLYGGLYGGDVTPQKLAAVAGWLEGRFRRRYRRLLWFPLAR